MPPVGIVDHLRNVIGNDKTSEAGSFECADRIDRVAVAITQKTLGEIIYRTLDISQVNIKDLADAGETFKRFLDLNITVLIVNRALYSLIMLFVWKRQLRVLIENLL